MKITLTKFRCYTSKEFDFPENDITLITGTSGAGKSSIFMAIQFALCGSGSRNIVTSGQTSCCVGIVFDDGFTVERSRRPNRLIVGDTRSMTTYEDDVAQEIINKRFGTSFNVTSYISQSAVGSFIMQSASEKIEFLERLGLDKFNISSVKQRCKALISQRNTELTVAMTKHDMCVELLGRAQKVEMPTSFPLPGKNKEIIARNEEIRSKNAGIMISKLKKVLSELTTQIIDVKVLNTFVESKNCHLKDLCRQLENLHDNSSYVGDDILNALEDEYKYICLLRKVEEVRLEVQCREKKLESLVDHEFSDKRSKLKSLKDELWKKYSKYEADELECSLVDIVDDMKIYSILQAKLSNAKDWNTNGTLIENLEASVNETKDGLNMILDEIRELVESSKVLSLECPSCKTSLELREGRHLCMRMQVQKTNVRLEDLLEEKRKTKHRLEITVVNVSGELDRAKINMSSQQKLEEEIKSLIASYENGADDLCGNISSFESDLKEIRYYKIRQETDAEHIEKLEFQISSGEHSYKHMTTEIINLKHTLQGLETTVIKQKHDNKESCGLNETELKDEIYQQQNNKKQLESYKKKKIELENEIDKIKYLIDARVSEHKSQYQGIRRTVESVERMLCKVQQDLKIHEDKLNDHVANISAIQKYNTDVVSCTAYNQLVNDVNEHKLKIDMIQKQHAGSKTLYNKILEAESIALSSLVSKINDESQQFLDGFFPDDPISIRLLPFKETKKTIKPHINLEIIYKDMECDLASLSGGELSRIILGYTLALANIFDSQMLLLDEPTASLDQESTAIVFDHVKSAYKDRGIPVIIIAHQIIEGVFDHVIKI